MPWISNHTGDNIEVVLYTDNPSQGNGSVFLVPPAIMYKTATATAPENSGNNYWTRTAAVTIVVMNLEGTTYRFTVQPDDHVNIYTDSYETHPARFGWFGDGPGNNDVPVY